MFGGYKTARNEIQERVADEYTIIINHSEGIIRRASILVIGIN